MSIQSRRRFIQTSISGVRAAATVPVGGVSAKETMLASHLPRQVWIAAFGQHGMRNDNPDKMIERTLMEMEKIAYYKPDVICLP